MLLVTGGSRGIGAAVALQAAQAGYDVAVAYRADAGAAAAVCAAVREAGAESVAVQADVGNEDDVVRLFAAVDGALGPPGALVNSAGIDGPRGTVAHLGAGALRRLFDVNVTGTIVCCREAVRRMSTSEGGAGGVIVNVSSMAATIGGRAGASAYAASKAAVDAFTVGLAKEVAEEGIRVNAVRPGMTLTEMTARLEADPALAARVADSIPMRRIATAEEIAAPIVWLLSPAASFVSGACVDASGGGFVVGDRKP